MALLKIEISDINPISWTPSLKKSSILTSSQILITKQIDKLTISLLDSPPEPSNTTRNIAKISKTLQGFKLKSLKNYSDSHFDDFWLVVSKQSPRYPLKRLATIRLFNSYFQLTKLKGFNTRVHTEEYLIEPKKAVEYEFPELTETKDPPIEVLVFCKFCLETNFTEENPFILPCQCKGGMGYVHISCFYAWADSRISAKFNDSFTVINWDTLHCTLCSSKIPESGSFQSIRFNIFKKYYPPSKYIVLKHVKKPLINSNTLTIINCENLSSFFLLKSGEICFSYVKNSVEILVSDSLTLQNSRNSVFSSVLLQELVDLPVGFSQCFINGSFLISVAVIKPSRFRKFFCCLYENLRSN